MRRRSRHALFTWLATLVAVTAMNLLTLGCDPEGEGETELVPDETALVAVWRPLVTAEGWRAIEDASRDPLSEHRPDEVICTRLGWYPEDETLEVDTSACNYLSIEHGLLEAVEPGDVLRLELWWQTLISLEPAEGHLALWIDGEQVWEERVTIPGNADARDVELTMDRSAPAGAPVVFHLHNHGTNTWRLRGLSVQRLEPAAGDPRETNERDDEQRSE